jgi:hypothetical protein
VLRLLAISFFAGSHLITRLRPSLSIELYSENIRLKTTNKLKMLAGIRNNTVMTSELVDERSLVFAIYVIIRLASCFSYPWQHPSTNSSKVQASWIIKFSPKQSLFAFDLLPLWTQISQKDAVSKNFHRYYKCV